MALISKNLLHFLFPHSMDNVTDLIKLAAGVYRKYAS